MEYLQEQKIKKGILIYNYSLYPKNYIPTGTCNYSNIDNFNLKLKLKNINNNIDDAIFKLESQIIKNNSKFVNVSILWDYFRFYGPEKEINNLIHEAFRAHCFHQMLPLDLNGKLKKLGYKNISSQNLSYLITNRDNNSPAIFYETMLSKFALSQGVSEDKVDDWKKQLNKSEKVGNFGFTSFPVLTAAYLG